MGNAAIDRAEVARPAEPVTETATEKTAGSDEQQSISEAGSTDSRRSCRPKHRPCRQRQRARLT